VITIRGRADTRLVITRFDSVQAFFERLVMLTVTLGEHLVIALKFSEYFNSFGGKASLPLLVQNKHHTATSCGPYRFEAGRPASHQTGRGSVFSRLLASHQLAEGQTIVLPSRRLGLRPAKGKLS
jgi:hypothetical protein